MLRAAGDEPPPLTHSALQLSALHGGPRGNPWAGHGSSGGGAGRFGRPGEASTSAADALTAAHQAPVVVTMRGAEDTAAAGLDVLGALPPGALGGGGAAQGGMYAHSQHASHAMLPGSSSDW